MGFGSVGDFPFCFPGRHAVVKASPCLVLAPCHTLPIYGGGGIQGRALGVLPVVAWIPWTNFHVHVPLCGVSPVAEGGSSLGMFFFSFCSPLPIALCLPLTRTIAG